MAAPDDLLYEYCVVRYVPRIDREEFINIGLLMLCKRQKWMMGMIHLDPRRLGNFDPQVDLKNLEKQSSVFERTDVPFPDLPVEEKYRWLAAVKSAILQTSPSHPGIIVPTKKEPTETDGSEISFNEERLEKQRYLEKEFERLFKSLVE